MELFAGCGLKKNGSGVTVSMISRVFAVTVKITGSIQIL